MTRGIAGQSLGVLPETGLLPSWAENLLNLGAALYRRKSGQSTVQVCLSLPTGSMAAAFVSCGAAIASLLRDHPEPQNEHYAMLCATESGTPITALKGDRLYSGWLEGPRQVMGQDCIAYLERTRKGKERRYLFKDRCLDIQLMPPETEPFAVAKDPFVDPMTPDVLDSLGIGAAAAAGTHFESAAVVFTVLTRFEEEMAERCHFSSVGSVPIVDVARPRRFLSSGVPYRTLVVPSSSTGLPGYVDESPPVVVFDGAQGYLRLRHDVDPDALVVLLDRWDPNSEAAAAAFMAECGGRGRSIEIPGFRPVSGMEAMILEVRR